MVSPVCDRIDASVRPEIAPSTMITKLAACEGVLAEAVVATGDHTWDACTPARDDHANSDLTIDCPTDFSAVRRAHKVAVRWLLEQSAYDCNSGKLRSLTKLRAKAPCAARRGRTKTDDGCSRAAFPERANLPRRSD